MAPVRDQRGLRPDEHGAVTGFGSREHADRSKRILSEDERDAVAFTLADLDRQSLAGSGALWPGRPGRGHRDRPFHVQCGFHHAAVLYPDPESGSRTGTGRRRTEAGEGRAAVPEKESADPACDPVHVGRQPGFIRFQRGTAGARDPARR